MGATAFSLADNVVKSAAGIVTGNGLFDLWTSQHQTLGQGLTSLRLVVDYESLAPAFGDNPLSFEVSTVVEGLNGGKWSPIAYQFEGIKSVHQGQKRILQLQPDYSTFDSGVDDTMFVGGEVLARISRQQGKLSDVWRVRMVVREDNFGFPGSFQTVGFDMYGETY